MLNKNSFNVKVEEKEYISQKKLIMNSSATHTLLSETNREVINFTSETKGKHQTSLRKY